MLCLLNSAVMPAGKQYDGIYTKRTISVDEYRQTFLKHKHEIKSYIAYPNAAAVVYELTGVKVELCRDLWDMRLGDTALCMQLRYRVAHDEKAGRKHGDHPRDYEYSIVHWRGAD